MAVGEKLHDHLRQVIVQGATLGVQRPTTFEARSETAGWLTRAQHIVHRLTPLDNPYRSAVDRILQQAPRAGFAVNALAADMVALLRNLAADLEAGVLISLSEQAGAEALGNLLEAAREYHRRGRKEGAGVLAGVVFEDTLRRVYRHAIGPDNGRSSEDLIADLVKGQHLNLAQAAQCRAAATLRNSATHAQWDQYDLRNVGMTIEFINQLLIDFFPR